MIARIEALLTPRLADFGLKPRRILARDPATGLAQPGVLSANRACALLRARDGWVALNLARPDDVDLVAAVTVAGRDLWSAVGEIAADLDAIQFRDWASELQLPVAIAGEAVPAALAPAGGPRPVRRVVDLASLWAGPLCAALLARAGAQVTRVESIGRPDPTPTHSPGLDRFLNHGKARLPLDLRRPADLRRLRAELAEAEVLVTNARPAALARLGLVPGLFPHLTWVAITAHGFSGPGATRVGFGDDCAVAGGLLDGPPAQPHFLGDALADPLTGLEAARAVLAGQRGLIDMAMARVAAAYAAML